MFESGNPYKLFSGIKNGNIVSSGSLAAKNNIFP